MVLYDQIISYQTESGEMLLFTILVYNKICYRNGESINELNL